MGSQTTITLPSAATATPIANEAALYLLTGLTAGDQYKTDDTSHVYEYLGGGESSPANWLDHSQQTDPQIAINASVGTSTILHSNTGVAKAWHGDIPDNAFQGTGETTLALGSSVTSIGSRVFNYCTGFTGDLTIPDSVTSIGSYAFNYCTGFTGDLTIPDSVTSIGSHAFNYCTGFTGDLTIPDSVTTIANAAFTGCSGFTGDLIIPDSVTTIGSSAFSGCVGFTGDLIIPDSVTTIANAAFTGCSGFTGDLTIPDSVTSIGSSAFSDCTGFTGDLTIPDSVTTIGSYAFNYCTGFTNVDCHTTRTIMNAAGCLTGTSVTTLHAEAGKGWTAGADTIGGKALTVIIDL